MTAEHGRRRAPAPRVAYESGDRVCPHGLAPKTMTPSAILQMTLMDNLKVMNQRYRADLRSVMIGA
jgi:hypothetical protein